MPGTGINLLIVDDEPATRALLSQIFARMGHSVRSAADGFSALELIRDGMPDILLSDLNMPGMSGFELLSVVRRRLPGIYVIATSGAYSGQSVPEGIAADAFYEKASNMQSLLDLMETAGARREGLGQRRSEPMPIWISSAENEVAGATGFMVSCPECLRPFVEVFRDLVMLIYQTKCPFCHLAIEYAVVEPLDPGTSQPFARRISRSA